MSQSMPTAAKPQVLRYTVLRHEDIAEPHWDLLLEIAGQELLVTWQIRIPPEEWHRAEAVLQAVRIGDHRRVYLDYEGPISGDRGFVRLAARGNWNLLSQTVDSWRVQLSGDISADLLLPSQE